MPIEHEIRDGELVWIRNPVTGVTSYVVDLRAKSFAFTLGERSAYSSAGPPLTAEQVREATERCPFCPGNENLATRELFRISPAEMEGWTGGASRARDAWVVRVFNNLFPRIPAELTGGRNESYIVVEDPRHFIDSPRSRGDLMHTGALGAAHFRHLLEADVRVMRISRENSAVRSIVVRKNQGRESGASQPHLHQQIIAAQEAFPAVAAEARAMAAMPEMYDELIALMERLGLIIEHAGSVVSYASPIGAFPRSYDVVMPQHRGAELTDLSGSELGEFAGAIYRILRIMGTLPLDYEIHQGEGLPLHAHLNARLYPYSNVAGTLNLPSTLLQSAAAVRGAIACESD
jgi:UDPglucose--hexose-1-phosphate uridylyltransferase